MKNKIINVTTILMMLIILLSCTVQSSEENNEEMEIEHGVVFSENGKFGGWPANNGIWVWGNEILVGFVEADFKETKGLHTYDSNTALHKYARSKDGGYTWIIEDAYEHGQTAWAHDNIVSDDKAELPEVMLDGVEDFTNPNFIITFQRHNNNNGPTHFYYSNNRGVKWEGPFIYPDLGTDGIASRTDYIVDGTKEMIAFLTVAKSNKKEGRVALSRTEDGGLNWEIVSWIGFEPEGFDIMPSSLRLSPSKLLTVIRTRTSNGLDLLTSYLSDDNGETWGRLKDPVADTGQAGTPPTLLKLQDGRLALGYVYRSNYGSRVNIRFSSDEGLTWSDEIVLRYGEGTNRDAGYPRMVQREDGKLVLIYYWNNANKKGGQPYRYIASTIVDPNFWN